MSIRGIKIERKEKSTSICCKVYKFLININEMIFDDDYKGRLIGSSVNYKNN